MPTTVINVGSNTWTLSPCENVELSHTWTIQRFGSRKEEVLQSSIFSSPKEKSYSLPSHHVRKKWELNLYPDGHGDEYKDYISLYLQLVKPVEMDVSCSFSLQDEFGNCIKKLEKNFTFTGKTDMNECGFKKFIKRDKLLNELQSISDVLKVTCQISYFNALDFDGGSKISSEMKSKEFDSYENFGALLNDGEFFDITLCVGESEFRAHRAILAKRSPYFDAMFKHDLKEKVENQIEIYDVKPEMFKEILDFIYTGNEPKNLDNESFAKEILVAADFFVLEKLKMAVENALISKLTIENACDFLIFGNTHSAEILETGAINFVAKNMKFVVETEGWEMMLLQHPNLTKKPILKAVEGRKLIKSDEKDELIKSDDSDEKDDDTSYFLSGCSSDDSDF